MILNKINLTTSRRILLFDGSVSAKSFNSCEIYSINSNINILRAARNITVKPI